jgi:YVTN family beta-propeller protein
VLGNHCPLRPGRLETKADPVRGSSVRPRTLRADAGLLAPRRAMLVDIPASCLSTHADVSLPVTHRLYVGSRFDHSLTVINTTTNTVVETLSPGNEPIGVAVNPLMDRVYVGNFGANTISVIGDIPPFYPHGAGATANPPTLFLDSAAPTGTSAKSKDSASLSFASGNPWKEIGTWTVGALCSAPMLTTLSNVRVRIGLKNSDDQGTHFDLRTELLKNGVSVAKGEVYCIRGVTRTPTKAREVSVPLVLPLPEDLAPTDALSLRIFTRIGTNGGDDSCGGHSNAAGLRLYFDAANRDARFGAAFTPYPLIVPLGHRCAKHYQIAQQRNSCTSYGAAVRCWTWGRTLCSDRISQNAIILG